MLKASLMPEMEISKLTSVLSSRPADQMAPARDDPSCDEPVDVKRTCTLVVDDDLDVLWVIAELLTAENHDVIQAKSAAEAIAIIAARHLDVVLTDVNLRNSSGADVADRAAKAGIPVIVMTGNSLMVERRQGRHPVLMKPFSSLELIDLIGDVRHSGK